MAYEYVIAGRRPLPSTGGEAWSTHIDGDLDDDDDDDEDARFDEGSCDIDEMSLRDAEYAAFVQRRAGFVPLAIVAVSPAGWEFSRAAAEVIAAALDGVYFCDAIEDDGPHRPFEAAAAPRTIAELEGRLALALGEPGKYFGAWAEADARAQALADARDPAAAAQRARDDDWSDV